MVKLSKVPFGRRHVAHLDRVRDDREPAVDLEQPPQIQELAAAHAGHGRVRVEAHARARVEPADEPRGAALGRVRVRKNVGDGGAPRSQSAREETS